MSCDAVQQLKFHPLSDPAVVWRESVVVGETDMDAQEVQEVVQQLGNEYRGNAYHLLERNCNHFSDELAFKLTGNHAPPWVRSS